MKCKCCGDIIEWHEFDNLEAFKERDPVDFKIGNFHLFCYELQVEEAMEIESNEPLKYDNRLDEYITKGLQLINT